MLIQKLTRMRGLKIMFALAMLCQPAMALAQGLPTSIQQNVASLLSNVIAGLNLLTWVVFFFLTILIDPNFIFDSGSSFEGMLNSIWVLSRDLMNVLFAVILIFAAIYTVITAKKDFISENMAKFVMAVVLVNFSWFVPRLILDVGSIAAATIYNIPTLILSEDSARACNFPSSRRVQGVQCDDVGNGKFVCQCSMVTNVRFFLERNQAKQFEAQGWNCPLGDIMCIKTQQLDVNSVAGHSAVLNGLIVNHARLQGLATIPPTANGPQIDALLIFLMRELVVLVIHIALFFPLLAMLVAFAIRIPVLWLTIAFMPFAILKYAVPDMFSQYVGEWPQKIMDYFLKAAFLPAVAGIPLTIGFIMINAGSNLTTVTDGSGRYSGLQMKITDNISDFWEILWLILSLGVIWAGVFSLLVKMVPEEFGQGAINGIKDFGGSMGKFAAKVPLALPILPAGAGGTLLGASKKFNFKAMDYKMSNDPEGIKAIFKDAKPNTVPAGTVAQSADTLSKTPADIKKLTASIKDLTDHIENDRTDGMNNQLSTIERTNNLTGLNKDNQVATFKQLLEELKKKKNGTNTAEITELEQEIQRLEQTKTRKGI